MRPSRRRACSCSTKERDDGGQDSRADRDLGQRLAARRRAHAVRRLQRRLGAGLPHRSRHQGRARGVRAIGRVAARCRRRHYRLDGAGELRYLLPAAPCRALFGRADRGAGTHGAAGVRHRPRSADAGRGFRHAQGDRAHAVRRRGVDEPQPRRLLQHARRLPHGRRRFQGFSVGSAARSGGRRQHGRHGGEPRAALPDHTRRGRRLRRAELRARGRGADIGLPRRRDRPDQERDIRACALSAARAQAQGRQGACRRHPCAPLPARDARRHPAGLRRGADRRQFLGHRRRRGGGARRLLRLRQDLG